VCGLAGLIGKSLDQSVSYGLITKAFEKAEARGTDAAGFWGSNQDGSVVYHKEPLKSSAMVKTEVWRKILNFAPDLMLVHARQTTPGIGESLINRNNHPFTSFNRTLGLIHNGRVPEFDTLKKKFKVLSDCDSEILLRILEASNLSHSEQEVSALFPNFSQLLGYRLFGIMDIFSMINYGHMAVAIGEILPDGSRYLWLFRNQHRSLWIVDLRDSLGQIFFCSTPEIWQEAIQDSGRHLLGRQKLIELPPEEVWFFQITAQQKQVQDVCRFRVERDKEQKQWIDNGTTYPVQQVPVNINLVTRLNYKDELDNCRFKKKVLSVSARDTRTDVLNKHCQEISNFSTRINMTACNMIRVNSLTDQSYQEVLDSLSQTECELAGTLKLLEK
jgi:predicted glutamine amidotransferase